MRELIIDLCVWVLRKCDVSVMIGWRVEGAILDATPVKRRVGAVVTDCHFVPGSNPTSTITTMRGSAHR